MKINFKARFRNKTFIISAASLIVAFVYQLLAMVNVVPSVTESEILTVLGMGVNILAFLGVLVDPTTDGISDSDRAMTYYRGGDNIG